MLSLLPLALLAAAHAPAALTERDGVGARLRAELVSADAIASIHGEGASVVFELTRGDRAVSVAVTTGAAGQPLALAIQPTSAAPIAPALAWLGADLRDAGPIVRVAARADGGIAIATADGRRYLLRASDRVNANAAVAARWAAAWDE